MGEGRAHRRTAHLLALGLELREQLVQEHHLSGAADEVLPALGQGGHVAHLPLIHATQQEGVVAALAQLHLNEVLRKHSA